MFYRCEHVMVSNYIKILVNVFKYKKLNLARDTLRISPALPSKQYPILIFPSSAIDAI